MPQIKSQIKRVRTNNKKTEAVKSSKSELKTAIKAVLQAVEKNDKATAVVALNNANRLLDESVTSHIHHRNYAARQKSRLSKLVNTIA